MQQQNVKDKNEQLVSQAVDCLTLVIEDEQEDTTIRHRCGKAREEAVNALLNFRSDDLELQATA
jgi:hypothetical protein